ncbi:D-alanyl-lipoteichoic acid biosynthesis protein DltB [Xylocopilactobacillus apis]|uniref:Teichoic acid D-alanyltransferase n=1 Tax=Xylocopilactobacillus apis TaxID=2932183 RepID=A0AAU9D0M5_9LACO|nr:D-alanyl-lipoteichoic acid biosynthesis protein DltB [Xylocopilactobacillus apis]BDR56051.1 D-alanyl-lipoteichoic acid biosynthesis protein DltB [Xylocopilactobacillus apis]
MIYFQPYENPMYFGVLFIALIPIIVLILNGRRSKIYESIISIFFLFLTFGGPSWNQGVALIIYTIYETVLTFAYSAYRKKANKSWIFYLAVFLAVLPLTLVKISTATHDQVQTLIGFLGISYLTFRVVQTIMETRDGVIKNLNLITFLQFLLFFPTISSGPIDRYRRFEKDYNRVPKQDEYLEMLKKGIHYIFIGFLYKFILAYITGTLMLPELKTMAMAQRGNFLGLSWPLLGVMYVYSADLFFDFAGYSLFAVGTSHILGINTPMNFNRPWQSLNIKDFWNRWHMSLSFWFRDYIYMRLLFMFMKKKTFKSRITAANVTYVLNMLIMGFWHGLTWYYITYGLFHGLAIVINDAWLRFKKKHQEQIPHNQFTKYFAIFLTANIVCFSFLIFSGFLNQLWFSPVTTPKPHVKLK